MTPALRLLRKKFPEARIDVAVRRGGELVLAENPDIDNLLILAAPRGEKNPASFLENFKKLCAQRYDYAFDLSGSDRARFWMLLSLARKRCAIDAYGELSWKRSFYHFTSSFLWGKEHQALKDIHAIADVLGIAPEIHPLVMNVEISQDILSGKLPFLNFSKPFAIIHPTSRWTFKQWTPERWAHVADALAENFKLDVIFSCGPDAKEIQHAQNILNLSKKTHCSTEGKLSLRELGALIKQSRIFLGVDTVAMHIAAAVQTPSVALFGPSSEWSWRPWECRHELALGDCSCKQTRKFICDKTRPYPCMESITVENVLEKTRLLL